MYLKASLCPPQPAVSDDMQRLVTDEAVSFYEWNEEEFTHKSSLEWFTPPAEQMLWKSNSYYLKKFFQALYQHICLTFLTFYILLMALFYRWANCVRLSKFPQITQVPCEVDTLVIPISHMKKLRQIWDLLLGPSDSRSQAPNTRISCLPAITSSGTEVGVLKSDGISAMPQRRILEKAEVEQTHFLCHWIF